VEKHISGGLGLVERFDGRLADSENGNAIIQEKGIILPSFQRGMVRQDEIRIPGAVVEVGRN